MLDGFSSRSYCVGLLSTLFLSRPSLPTTCFIRRTTRAVGAARSSACKALKSPMVSTSVVRAPFAMPGLRWREKLMKICNATSRPATGPNALDPDRCPSIGALCVFMHRYNQRVARFFNYSTPRLITVCRAAGTVCRKHTHTHT